MVRKKMETLQSVVCSREVRRSWTNSSWPINSSPSTTHTNTARRLLTSGWAPPRTSWSCRGWPLPCNHDNMAAAQWGWQLPEVDKPEHRRQTQRPACVPMPKPSRESIERWYLDAHWCTELIMHTETVNTFKYRFVQKKTRKWNVVLFFCLSNVGALIECSCRGGGETGRSRRIHRSTLTASMDVSHILQRLQHVTCTAQDTARDTAQDTAQDTDLTCGWDTSPDTPSPHDPVYKYQPPAQRFLTQTRHPTRGPTVVLSSRNTVHGLSSTGLRRCLCL